MATCTMPAFSRLGVVAAAIATAWCGSASAQCTWDYVDTEPTAELYHLALWDRDGSGPLPPKLVVGGRFDRIADIQTQNVAVYDLEHGTWEALGAGLRGTIGGFAVLPNGDLVVGGNITSSGASPINYPVVRWNGAAWSPIGTDFPNDSVYTLAVPPSGELVASGYNTGVRRWDGAAWQIVGESAMRSVWRMIVAQDGSLLAARWYSDVGDVQRFDGSAWQRLGAGASGVVRAIMQIPNGDIVISGDFEWIGRPFQDLRTEGVARWDGGGWSAVGPVSIEFTFPPRENRAILALPNGDILVGKRAGLMAETRDSGLRRWNGQYWSRASPQEFGPFVQSLLMLPDGRIAVAAASSRLYFFHPGEGSTPVITQQPADLASSRGVGNGPMARVTVTDPATLYYDWRFNGQPIWYGVASPSPYLGYVTYRIFGAGLYDCVISNGCNSVISRQAHLTFCYTDFARDSQGLRDGGVTVDDLMAFLEAYSSGSATADVDDGTGRGRQDFVVSFDDLHFFLARYAEGC